MGSILMLVPLDKHRMDVGGNVYPLEGVIVAENFSKNLDIREGLLGILEGECDDFFLDWLKAELWIVVEVENDSDLVHILYYNMVKFKQGFIVYEGTIKKSLNYIRKKKNENSVRV